jgi:hypothetical protein
MISCGCCVWKKRKDAKKRFDKNRKSIYNGNNVYNETTEPIRLLFFYFLILLFKNKINFIKINENRFNHYFKI